MTENDAMIAYDREMMFWHQKKSVLDNSAVFVFWRAIQQKKKIVLVSLQRLFLV